MNHNILDNRQRGTVAEFLQANLKTEADVCIVSAYFTIYAYQALKKELEHIKHLRFLFGEPNFLKLDPSRTEPKSFSLLESGITMEDTMRQKSIAKECAEWIQAKVDIKSMEKPDFLHGKMYHITQKGGIQAALLGSSNFTMNGIGAGKNANLELNIVVRDDRDRNEMLEWFDTLWKQDELDANTPVIPNAKVKNVKAEVLNYLAKVYQDKSPEYIYIKTLYHLFEERIKTQIDEQALFSKIKFDKSKIWTELYDFQQQGVKSIINKILKHNGCILADSVGLGKTFEALAVIKYFELQNHRVLVLCPKKLRDNWAIYASNDDRNTLKEDRFGFDVLSHTDLTRTKGKVGNIDLENLNWGNYGLVVIDESHNFRNSGKSKFDADGNLLRQSRYEKLMQSILKEGLPTKVLLLSATPVNNSLRDLKNQIHFITQGEDDALWHTNSIKSVQATLDYAQKTFAKWANPKLNPLNRSVHELMDRLTADFFTLLDEVTIARSRKHILAYYNCVKPAYPEAERLPMSFPKRLKNRNEYPNIDLKNKFPSFEKINQDIIGYKFALFNPARYVVDDASIKASYGIVQETQSEFSQATRETNLIGMVKVGFLKRLESSIYAFYLSLNNTIAKIDQTIAKIKAYQTKQDLKQEVDIDLPEDIDEEMEEDLVGKKLKYKLQDLNLNEWLKDLETDKAQLQSLANNAEIVTTERDAKLQRLKTIIAEKKQQPLNGQNRKVLVFTAYADTAKYLYDNLQAWAVGEQKMHIGLVTGGSHANQTTFVHDKFKKQTDFEAILTNFAPIAKNRHKMKSMPQEGEIDILIATDCISEGQNLQDCDFLINYDIHWNPVRLVQRFGRIDRLGSQNQAIQMLNFWATPDLDKYLNLKLRVEAKMAIVDLTATATDNILMDEEDSTKQEIQYRYEQLKKMQHDTLDLEEGEEGATLDQFTLDEFFAFLLQYINKQRDELAQAPLGMYAIVPQQSERYTQRDIEQGIIFCFRQREKTNDLKQFNPLNPYFLVYAKSNGEIKYNYANAHTILMLYSQLCQGVGEPYEALCDLFDQKTQQGKDLQAYQNVVAEATKVVRNTLQQQNRQKETNTRGGRTEAKTDLNPQKDLELITWLIIE